MENSAHPNADLAFLAGGGEMGAFMRNYDWAATSLGEPEGWPQSLRAAVSIMLNSRFPIALYWGPDLALLYNDDWKPIPGAKHPWALGRPANEVWPEIWDTIGPLFDRVIKTGEGVWQQDQPLHMHRHGYLEECYFNFTFSPVRDQVGKIDGIFNAAVETTDRVVSERRLRTLSRMGERTDMTLSVEAACAQAVAILVENVADAPFAFVYVRDNGESHLAATGGPIAAQEFPPPTISLQADASAPWPLGEIDQSGAVSSAPTGVDVIGPLWPEAIAEVSLTPIRTPGASRATAYLIVGVNPRRPMDPNYRSFLEVAAGHIGNAIATAKAHEEERRRADALAEIDRAKTAFFSNVSHEFRTPLTLMLGPLEDALAAADSTPDQRARLDLAHRNALRLLRLVNTLLDFSRIEAGRIEAIFQPTDLAALTAELASSFSAATERAGLRLIVDAPTLSTLAHIDRDMWEKIVLNLVSNAFKFTHQGEIEVSLRDNDGNANLVVRDTGTGIPAAELPKLFDRFHRVEGAKGRSFEGSGIGLALVQELVKLHGGNITVKSEEGVGSAFTVSIPLGSAHLPMNRLAAEAQADTTAKRAQSFVEEALRWLPADSELSPVDARDEGALLQFSEIEPVTEARRVLVADDNADLRDYIVRLLTERGYEAESVPDGGAAFAAARARRPDLMITDVMMPGLDGFGLLRALRSDEHLRDLPVIMLSARAGEEAKVEGLDAGADDYLTKPLSARELLARVSANIKLARLRQEAAETIRASERHLRELNETLNQRVADALAERRLLADLVEGTDAFVQVADLEFRWLAINKASADEFERIYGARPKVGDSMLDLLANRPEHQEAVRAVWSRALAGEEFTQIDEFGDPGLERRCYEMKFNVLRGIDGKQTGAYQFVYDVTDRVHEQRRLADAEEALRQSRKMEAMGQLTGGVAHDFNNLLTPIVGALDMLLRKEIGGEREQRLIAGAAQSAERAKVLVQRLLAFARRQPLQAVAVDVGSLIEGMGGLISSTTGPQIKVVVEVSDALPWAKADPNQLEMALLNLAVNARDAMTSGGTLRITATVDNVEPDARSDLRPGRYVRLSVSDTGAGMDEATLARATEPFFSTKGVGKGTGLGLPMVHGLAAQLGGAMTIKSRLGLGTNVELWLPEENEPAEAVVTASETPKTEGSGTVLLIDDEEFVRLSTADMLNDLGYKVLEASSAEEGLAVIRNGTKVDLVVTDHLMPGMTGTDLARAVQTLCPCVPILMISGFAESEGIEPDLPRLTKPFRRDELAASLASLSNGSN